MQKTILIFLIVLINTTISFGQNESDIQKILQLDSMVKVEWINVENCYQRRSDIIPNWVNILADLFEKEDSIYIHEAIETYTKVVAFTINSEILSQEDIDKFYSLQSSLDSSIVRLAMISLTEPELKENKNINKITDEMMSIETRLKISRDNYNAAAKAYNHELSKLSKKIKAKYNLKPKGIFKDK